MASTTKVEGWGLLTFARILADLLDRCGPTMAALSIIGIIIEDRGSVLLWGGVMGMGVLFCFIGGFMKHYTEAVLEERQKGKGEPSTPLAENLGGD